MFVPTMLIRLVFYPRCTPMTSATAKSSFGTAPSLADKLQQAIAVFMTFNPNYGLSEATQPVLCMSPQDLALAAEAKRQRRLVSAGRPALGVEDPTRQ